MDCPSCEIELTSANQKVEFEDKNKNAITIIVEAQWCHKCGYIDCVS